MNWNEVRPVLEATYQLLAEEDNIDGDEVAAVLGRPPNDQMVGRALEALHKAGYIEGRFAMQTPMPLLITSTEKGLQETAGWPKPGTAGPDQVELLLQVLDERVAAPDVPTEEKGRLGRIRNSFVELGRDVAVGVLTAYAAKASGAGD